MAKAGAAGMLFDGKQELKAEAVRSVLAHLVMRLWVGAGWVPL